MDLQQTKILLEKINALHKSISLNKGTISAIERDLMLSYVRQLYEACLQEGMPVVAPSLQQQPVVSSEKEIPPPPKPQELEQPKKSYTPPKIIEIAEPSTPIIKKQEPILSPPPTTFQQEPTVPPKPDSYNIRSIAPSAGRANFNALFDFKQAKELSEKLGDRPVSDLTKAFAINDKLLYINELFNKDTDSFNESLKLLNKFDGMDEAKSLLINLAEQYNWIHEEKVEIAQTFIKVIRRRYV